MYDINWPNRLTILRILLVGPFVVALMYLQDPRWGEFARRSALVVFALMAISDGLDGYLARRLHQETAVGRFLDPVADKVMILFSMILLAHQGTNVTGALLRPAFAVIAIGKDLIVVVGFFVVYLTTTKVFIEPRRSGKWCTVVQLLMVLAILLSPDLPGRLARAHVWLGWAASVLALVTIGHYFHIGMRFIDAHDAQVANRKDHAPGSA